MDWDDKKSIKDMCGFKMVRWEQCVEMKEGLIKVVERLNKEFPDERKFQLKVYDDCDSFEIYYKKKLLFGGYRIARIEVLDNKIGYKPYIYTPREIIEEYLNKFSQKHNIRISGLSGF